MGAYINPKYGQTKSGWLANNGMQLTIDQANEFIFNDSTMLVCLIDNGFMTAAAIAFEQRELDYIKKVSLRDDRLKEFYTVPIDLLWDVSDLDTFLNKPSHVGEPKGGTDRHVATNVINQTKRR